MKFIYENGVIFHKLIPKKLYFIEFIFYTFLKNSLYTKKTAAIEPLYPISGAGEEI